MDYLIIAVSLTIVISIFGFFGWALVKTPELMKKQINEDKKFVEKADAPVIEETVYGFIMLKRICIGLSVAYLGFMIYWTITKGAVPTIIPLLVLVLSSAFLSKRVKNMNEELENKNIEQVAGGDRPR